MSDMSNLGAKLFDRMQDAYHATGARGVCEFEIAGSQAEAFHVVLDENRISFGPGKHPNPSSRVRMTDTIANFLHDSAEDIEFRSPTFARQMEVQGDVTLAFSLGLLLRRPPAATVARFENAARISHSRPPVTQVERLRRPSTRDVVQCLAEERPVIVEGALDHWPLPESLEDFAARFGESTLPVDPRIVQHRNVADLVRGMCAERPDHVYTHGCEIPAAMQSAFPPPFFENHGPPAIAQLWMGCGHDGTRPVTLLHRDDLHGLLAQLYGFKRVLLYSPDQSELLYPSKAFTNSQPCHVDPADADLRRYPLFSRARALEARLGPGEILVNPLGWFHCVFAEDRVISLSYSFRAQP